MLEPVIAVRVSRCNQCKEDILPAEEIVRDTHGRWVHSACPDEPIVSDPKAFGGLCPDCHLHHRGECF
ncbi:hypothetical protein SEA_BUTTON_51 [Gordonia phage Button]|nr:hypothetical protein SEA_BUTTON_51 [Gordonia phage Button]